MKPVSNIHKFVAMAGADYSLVFSDYLSIISGVGKQYSEPCALAKEIASHNERPGVVFEAFTKVFGMTTSDLAQTTEALARIVAKKVKEPIHRKLTHFVEAVDFKESAILTAFEDIREGSQYKEGSEIPYSFVSDLESNKATTKRHPTRVIIPYETIRNQTDWVNTIPPAMLAGIYREESEALFAMLESNPTMQDSNPLFIENNTKISAFSFEAILALFRSQKTAITGHVVGADPKYIVVPSDNEVSIRKEINLCNMSNIVEVVSRPDITNMYLLADPESSPTIARFAIQELPSVFVEPVPKLSRALAVRGENDFDFVPVSRYGICRLTPS
jgi:hypothetical protein